MDRDGAGAAQHTQHDQGSLGVPGVARQGAEGTPAGASKTPRQQRSASTADIPDPDDLPWNARRRGRTTRFAVSDANRDRGSDDGGGGDAELHRGTEEGEGATTQSTRGRLATSFTAAAVRADSQFGGSRGSIFSGRGSAMASGRGKQVLVSGEDRFPAMSGPDGAAAGAVTRVRRW